MNNVANHKVLPSGVQSFFCISNYLQMINTLCGNEIRWAVQEVQEGKQGTNAQHPVSAGLEGPSCCLFPYHKIK